MKDEDIALDIMNKFRENAIGKSSFMLLMKEWFEKQTNGEIDERQC